MSFQDFLKIAQRNQSINDGVVKKLSEEQKRKKELFLKERKAIEAANKSKKRVESYEPHSTSSKNEYDPSAALEILNKKPIASSAMQSFEAEYVPTPIPKTKKGSSLMDVLEEINGKIPSFEKRFKIETRVPKIGGPTDRSSHVQRKPDNNHLNGHSLPNLKVKSRSAVSSLSKAPNRTIVFTNPTSRVLAKPGTASQQGLPFNKLSSHKLVQKPAHTNKLSTIGRNQSSARVSRKAIPHKLPSNLPFQSEKPLVSSLKPALKPGMKTKDSTRLPSSTPLSLGSTTSTHPPRGIAAQYGLIPSPLNDPDRPKMSIPKPISSTAIPQPTPKGRIPNRSSGNPTSATKRLSGVIKNGIPAKRRAIDLSRPLRPPPPPRVPLTQPPNQPIVRGIAAQLGVFPSRGHYGEDYDDDSDDYESDDSFIDDSICTSAKEYKIARNEIYKTLHFNPNKYAKVSKYDDLSTMESSYQRIEREERLSLRAGAREDREDMAREEERRRRRQEKST
ncbi:hypothetical protein Aperf_G00000060938 [Anoplocephala perfoliata]